MLVKLHLHKNTSKKVFMRIKNPYKKIRHLFSIYSDAYEKHEAFLIGLLDMVEGLEYHFKRHLKFEERANKGFFYGYASHEAVAYINRLGQLYYLFTSEWFQKPFLKGEIALRISTILALDPIRNKFTAHRQIDWPRKDDCATMGLNVHKLVPGRVGKINEDNLKIQYQFPTKQRNEHLKQHHHPEVKGVEYLGDSNMIVFEPTILHPKIMEEIFDAVEFFLCSESSIANTKK